MKLLETRSYWGKLLFNLGVRKDIISMKIIRKYLQVKYLWGSISLLIVPRKLGLSEGPWTFPGRCLF